MQGLRPGLRSRAEHPLCHHWCLRSSGGNDLLEPQAQGRKVELLGPCQFQNAIILWRGKFSSFCYGREASGPITSWQVEGGTVEGVTDFIFLGFKITADGDCSHEIKRRLLLGRKVMTNLDSILKSRDITLSTKVLSSQGHGFSSSHVWMWELDYKESWAPKNWCFWTVVLEKTLESPLDCKEIQPVHPKGDQSWVFIGGTDVENEIPILWPPDEKKSWLIWEDPDGGKDWGQEEKGTTEDEMVGWHHWLDGHGFVWTLGVGDG